jgi:5'-3' exonuclease
VTKRRTTVEKVDGDHLHMLQTLAGDPVDNYDGIPGIGFIKAEKILAPAKNCPVLEWELVLDAYVEHLNRFEPTEGESFPFAEAYTNAIQQARLAKILQWEDYDMTKKEVKLWLPPKK